ncbi:hypothetical protein DFH06DRAFT_210369 [Mycena polygramma]|nr:hypothetical protein DFH06DRAFT_210369 [Mycena polygramma]
MHRSFPLLSSQSPEAPKVRATLTPQCTLTEFVLLQLAPALNRGDSGANPGLARPACTPILPLAQRSSARCPSCVIAAEGIAVFLYSGDQQALPRTARNCVCPTRGTLVRPRSPRRAAQPNSYLRAGIARSIRGHPPRRWRHAVRRRRTRTRTRSRSCSVYTRQRSSRRRVRGPSTCMMLFPGAPPCAAAPCSVRRAPLSSRYR